MLLVGIAALLQICYLPGAVLRRWLRLDDLDGLEQASYGFALSLMANTGLVALLVLLHTYTRTAIWIVIALEAAILARAVARARPAVTNPHTPSLLVLRSSSGTAGAIYALSSIGILLFLCYLNWGTVFNANDDVASWNRWAIEWSQSVWPTRASYYPQLLPANWSISYVLLGRTDIQMFAKFTTTLYPLAAVALLLSLARRRQTAGPLFGAGLFVWIFLHYLGSAFMMLGYADIPVAFFALLALHAVERRAGGAVPSNAVALSLLFAAGALITKQGGVYALAAAAAYAAWHRWRQRPAPAGDLRVRIAAAVAIAFAAVWFGIKWWQISAGTDYSNIDLLTHGLHQGRSYSQRLVHAADMFWTARGSAGPPVAAFLGVLLAGSLAIRTTRWITAAVILPFLISWGWWFSYEVRNAAMCFGLVALVAGVTLDRILTFALGPIDRRSVGGAPVGPLLTAMAGLGVSVWMLLGHPQADAWSPTSVVSFLSSEWIDTALWWYAVPAACLSGAAIVALALQKTAGQWRIAPWIPAAAVVLLAGVAMTGPYSADRLAASQLELRRQIGSPAVNRRLYAAVRARNIQSPIMTDYWFVRALPGLESLFTPILCGPCTYDHLLTIAKTRPDVGYFLIEQAHLDPSAWAQLAKSTELQTIFAEGGVQLLYIDRGEPRSVLRVPNTVGATVNALAGGGADLRVIANHPDGAAHIQDLIVIINSAQDGRQACYFQWYRATGTVTLANDNGVGWIGEKPFGVPGTLANAQCTLDLGSASLAESDTMATWTFRLRVTPAFAGSRNVYANVLADEDRASGYHLLASADLSKAR